MDITCLTTSDLIILANICNKKDNIGLHKGRGATRNVIVEGSKLSKSTVIRGVTKLLDLGFIDFGVKKANMKTYYVTEKGLEFLREVKGKGGNDNVEG